MTALDTKALLTGVTPGDWRAETAWVQPPHYGIFYDGAITPIARIVSPENARLIASAPRLARRVIELEEALKLARAAAEHFNVRLSPNELAQVDAALKGEGE